MGDERKVGELLDSLNVTADLDDTDLVTDALVILRVTPQPGQDGVVIAASEGLTHLTELGMATRAADIIRRPEENE